MATNPSTSSLNIEQLFHTERYNGLLTSIFLYCYSIIGCIILILRVFIGFHTFIVACFLRKSNALRNCVLKLMCTVLGIVTKKEGERDETARVLVSNHVSILDHLAVNLFSPCLLPSVWDIPTLVRWCFGYVDLDARKGRDTLIRNAKELISTDPLPLLAFPEGVITSGHKALIKFNTWCFEVSDTVQPVAISVTRPTLWNVSPSLIGASWWLDFIYFFALPYTTINVKYLPKVTKNEDESVDEFSARVSKMIADELNIVVSNFVTRDASEAFKRWAKDKQNRLAAAQSEKKATRLVDPRQMDECAMRIKQSYPNFHLSLIRKDLEKTKNQTTTINNIKNGKIPNDTNDEMGKITLDASSWKNVFNDRKWSMIEVNRSKYLKRDA